MATTVMQAENTFVPFSSNGRKVYVISDLHIANEMNKNGNYAGTENFYADQSFVRFVDYLQQQAEARTGMLIINGDFIDFLRIRDIPETDDDFRCWQEILHHAGIEKTAEELQASIVQKERDYGLKTNYYKSIWKLHVCMKGHKALFKRVAQWVSENNELIVVKGNHDLEWYWSAVQRYLRYALEKMIDEIEHYDGLQKSMTNRIHFINYALTIDDKIYIEHGHLYERTTAVVGNPTVN